MSDSLRPHGLYSPWNSPGQNTGVGSCSLLQGIFPTQGLNPGLLHCRQILYCLSHQGSLAHVQSCWLLISCSAPSLQWGGRISTDVAVSGSDAARCVGVWVCVGVCAGVGMQMFKSTRITTSPRLCLDPLYKLSTVNSLWP